MSHGINNDSTRATKARASSTVRGLRSVMRPQPKVYHEGRGGYAEDASAASRGAPLRTLCSLCGEVSLVAQFGDDPERLLAAGDALEIVEGVAPALPMIVPGRPGAVRAEDRVLQGKELVVGLWRLLDHDVEPGTEDLLVAQCHV